ncbi:hypothetical protein Bca101_059267 [Brassica carinata]
MAGSGPLKPPQLNLTDAWHFHTKITTGMRLKAGMGLINLSMLSKLPITLGYYKQINFRVPHELPSSTRTSEFYTNFRVLHELPSSIQTLSSTRNSEFSNELPSSQMNFRFLKGTLGFSTDFRVLHEFLSSPRAPSSQPTSKFLMNFCVLNELLSSQKKFQVLRTFKFLETNPRVLKNKASRLLQDF